MVLDRVVSSEHPLGLMEIAKAVGLDKSVTSRLLRSLERRAFLQRDSASKKYSLGSRFIALSITAIQRSGLAGIARNHLRRLRDRIGETVSIHLLVGRSRVCIDGNESPHEVRRALTLGEALPIYLGPSSKAIMAFLPEHELLEALQQAREAGIDVGQLERQLAALRQQKYLSVSGDRTPSVGAISAPIFDSRGVTASLTAAGPIDRWTPPRMETFAGDLLSTAAAISRELGGNFPMALPVATGRSGEARS